MKSWIEVSSENHFPIQNIPFGVFSTSSIGPRCGVAIGDYVVDLIVLHNAGLFNGLPFDSSIFGNSTLNAFMELERPCWRAARARLTELLDANGDPAIRDNAVKIFRQSKFSFLIKNFAGSPSQVYLANVGCADALTCLYWRLHRLLQQQRACNQCRYHVPRC